MATVEPSAPRAATGELSAPDGSGRTLTGRLGLSVPYDWWPSAPLLKSFEAAGFDWVQLHSPPLSVLADPRQLTRHGAAAAASLGTTALSPIVHAPPTLRLGDPSSDRAFEGLLSYAAELGAEQVVYHALALPDAPESEPARSAEVRSLANLAGLAERLEVTIAIENLAPLYPGPVALSANPMTLRGQAQQIGSDRVSVCLDVGHAHICADLSHTGVERLCEPVVDVVSVFHVHDNLGARWTQRGEELGVDPLRLDLHLPPDRGTLPWHRVGRLLSAHRAPLILEVHPPYRPRAAELASTLRRLLG
jgi:sugar phosphate isomerase/epimerase